MNLSVRGGKRPVVVIATALLLSLGACSGESSPDDEPASKATTSATPTSAETSADQAAVSSLVTQYWATSVKAQNSGDESPEQFADVARGSFVETTLKSIREAKADGAGRTGRPEITEIEVAVDGDAADIKACLNEDDWPFVKDGKILSINKRGAGPWGAEATRSGATWMITDVRLPPAGSKDCA